MKSITSRLAALRNKFPRKQRDSAANAERELVFTLAKSRVPNLRQLRYLPRILSRSELFLVRGLSGFIVVALIFLGARVYARNVTQLPKAGGEVVEGLLGNPQYVNPVLEGTNDVDRDLSRLLYAGLLRRNQQGTTVPDLAESYDLSSDGKVYTVKLRPNLTWSDDKPLTIDDVLLTFDLITDPLYKSPLRSQFRNVKIERVDDNTLKFTLTQSSSAFLSLLTVGILPAHIWGDVPPPNFGLIEYNVRPVGAGPFKFDSLKRDTDTGYVKEYRLIRNPNYTGTAPYLDKLTFKFFQDTTSMAEAIRMKSVESISVVDKNERAALKQVRGVDLQLLQYSAIFFNAKRGVVKYPEIRKALAAAINRGDIAAKNLKGSAQVVDGPFPPAIPGYAGAIQPLYSVDEANRILEDTGWKRQDSGIRKKGNEELTVSLSVVDQDDDLTISEQIKSSWEAIGAKVEVKHYDPTRIAKEVVKPRDYDAFLYGEILSPDGDLYPFWHSTQEQDPGLNLTRFFNKDADKLLEELRTETNADKIAEKRVAFQKLLADSGHVIFLNSPYYTYGLSKRVKGFSMSYVTGPADRFNGVASWFVKTQPTLKKK